MKKLGIPEVHENPKYSIDFSDKQTNDHRWEEVSKEIVGIVKQICGNTNVALLYLKHGNELIKTIANAKVMYCAKNNIRCFDFSNDYKSLIKKVKANRI